jgi:alpha-ribazole phosphatase/probable phosphoglycerate mutase
MDTTRVYLIRHGQVANHHEFRYNGHNDVDITTVGRAQMERLAGYLSEDVPADTIKAVYSSDLKRAYKGALIIGSRLGLEPVRVPDLRELHLGRWEGLTREEATEKYPDEAHISFRDLATSKFEGGESLVELRQRVLPAAAGIARRHGGGAVCMVLHGGVNRVILGDAMGIPVENFFTIEQDYGCLNVIEHFEDGVKVVKMLNGGPNQSLSTSVIY